MKILITGSKGQLGSELQLLAADSTHQFDFTDIEELDITDELAIGKYFREKPFNLLINCAAYTAVDRAEQEVDKALLINATAPRLLAEKTGELDIPVIHISTDFVFDGTACRPYVEENPVGPVSAYGQTKCDGEANVLKKNHRSIIIRTSWLYSSFGNNFLKTMIRLGTSRDELGVVFDQVGTPTYARDLARAILAIADTLEKEADNFNAYGLYHFSNEGVASWYDFAHEIFRLTDIRTSLRPILTKDFPLPARRPYFSVLDKTKIKSVFGLHIPHWKDSLQACISALDEQEGNVK